MHLLSTLALISSISVPQANVCAITQSNIVTNKEKEETNLNLQGNSIIPNRQGNKQEISKFSDLADHWEFFTKLHTKNEIGYCDDHPNGLCEYIAISMIYTYFQIYGKNHNFYSKDIINRFFDGNVDSDHYKQKYVGSKETKSFVWYMYSKMHWLKNWYWGSDARHVTQKIINNGVSDDYCVSTMHTSSPEEWLNKYHTPVLLVSGIYGHAVLVYGYDFYSKSYAVNYGFPDGNESGWSMRIIKKGTIWSYWKSGFWYGMHE